MDFDNLPEGWTVATINDLQMSKTQGIVPKNFPDDVFELWSVPAFSSGQPEYITGIEIESNKQKVKPNDVLLCKINPRINRVWKVNQKKDHEQIASTEWILIRCNYINPDYLVYYFQSQSFRNAFCADVSGVGGSLMRARPQYVEKLYVKIPPLNEQKRIVAKIEQIQEKSQVVKNELEKIKVLLKKLRRSLLASAFRGDLTKDWRANHPDIEPAEVLLERIKQERRSKWEQAELEKMRVKGITPKDDKWKSKYSEPQPIKNIDDLPSIPDGWCWANVDLIASKVTDGVHKKPEYIDEGIPFITVKNLTATSGISFDKLNYISEKDHQEYIKRANPEKGDILISKDGTLGVIRAVRTDKIFSIFVSVALVKPLFLHMTDYIEFVLSSPQLQKQMVGVGIGLTHIHLRDLKNYVLPLPPLEEQKEIVRKLEKMMKFADQVEERVKEAEEKLNKFNQSVLAKAFRGKLVPQDPNDEPAAVLLGKIQQEKNKTTGKKTKK